MKKLEIELYRYDKLVFGKVIYQDESLRDSGLIIEKNGFKIESCSGPALHGTRLFIRGENKQFDKDMFYYRFCDEETATKICETIVDCVNSINCEDKMQSLERVL